MRRTKGWESRLKAVVEYHMNAPFEWGKTDCFMLVAQAVEAQTGERIMDGIGTWTTELGAARILRRHGFVNVAEALASRFEEIPVSYARRGDIGIAVRDGRMSAGVFVLDGLICRGKQHSILCDRASAESAFSLII